MGIMRSRPSAWIIVISALLLAAGLAQTIGTPIQVRTQQLSSLTATILDDATGKPLAGAEVALLRTVSGSNPPYTDRAVEAVLVRAADTSGHVTMENLEPGPRAIFAFRVGYEPKPMRVRLEPGQPANNVVVRMRSLGGAVFTGRVFNTAGDPATGARVSLYRLGYDRKTALYESSDTAVRPQFIYERTIQRSDLGDHANIDDRGEFRVSGVPAGRYLIVIQGCRYCTERSLGSVFYPGVQDPFNATILDVTGGEIRLGAVVLPRMSASISVRIKTEAGLNLSPSAIASSAVYTSPEGFPRLAFQASSGTNDIPVNLPGTYYVHVGAKANYVENAEVRTNFSGADTEVSATLGYQSCCHPTGVPQTVKGHTIEGRVTGLPIGVGRMDFIAPEMTCSANSCERAIETARVLSDGTFRLTGLADGVYNLAGFGKSGDDWGLDRSGWVIVSARQQERDALRNGVLVSGANTSAEIRFTETGGQISGNVRDSRNQPVHDAIVVLLPDSAALKARTDRSNTYRTERSDQTGAFEFRGIVPGTYQIYAWNEADVRQPSLERRWQIDNLSNTTASTIFQSLDNGAYREASTIFQSAVENGAYRDPQFMAAFRDGGRSITVPDNGKTVVGLRIAAP